MIPDLWKKNDCRTKRDCGAWLRNVIVRAVECSPRIVNTQKTLASFKTYLGNFLDILPDKPPTPGYSAVNSNSMIDWCSQGGGPQIALWP